MIGGLTGVGVSEDDAAYYAESVRRGGAVVTVRGDDFEYQGRPYKSLSAIAREITGVRWNGWVFFGLKNHRGAA